VWYTPPDDETMFSKPVEGWVIIHILLFKVVCIDDIKYPELDAHITKQTKSGNNTVCKVSVYIVTDKATARYKLLLYHVNLEVN
jgi:hypothetical protein